VPARCTAARFGEGHPLADRLVQASSTGRTEVEGSYCGPRGRQAGFVIGAYRSLHCLSDQNCTHSLRDTEKMAAFVQSVRAMASPTARRLINRPTALALLQPRSFSSSKYNMGVTVETIQEGNGSQFPKAGDKGELLCRGPLHAGSFRTQSRFTTWERVGDLLDSTNRSDIPSQCSSEFGSDDAIPSRTAFANSGSKFGRLRHLFSVSAEPYHRFVA
jgi:hypothetical protein